MSTNLHDEVVVGGGGPNVYDLQRIEEEMKRVQELEQEEENKPLEERIKSKNWKIRKNAYAEILKNLKSADSGKDPIFSQYSQFYSEILGDAHAGAQESAVEVVKQVLENFEDVEPLIPDLFKNLLEKCYTSSKAVLKQKAKEVLVLSVEMSQDVTQITESIKSGLENKNQKIQQGSLTILTHLISLFGSFKIEYRNLITLVEKLADNPSPMVRADALDFYKELYKWIRQAIKPYVARLKDTHQKDLEKAFDDLNSKFPSLPNPSKFLKCDKEKMINQQSNTDEVKSKMLLLQEEEKIFKSTEAVELFQDKFNENWAEDIMAKERKWIEKKEMLESFINVSNVLKINNSGRAHIIVVFNKLLKDNNINVVNCVILAINNMAKGLRKDFTEAKDFLFPILEKFKEKKEKLVTDVFACLESLMMHCINLDEIIDDLKSFVKNEKSLPSQSKERFCIFIEKTVLKTFMPMLRKVCKPLAEMMFTLSDDASPDVRHAALNTIGVIKFRVGDMPISKVLNEINNIKKAKVDEAAKKVEVDPIYDKDDTPQNNKKSNNITGNNNLNSTKPGNNNNISNSNNMNKMNKMKSSDNLMDVDVENNLDAVIDAPILVPKKPKFDPSVTNDIEMNPVNSASTANPPKQLAKSHSTNNITKKPAQNKPAVSNVQNENLDMDVEEDTNMSNEDLEILMREKLGGDTIALFNDSKWDNRKQAFTNLAEYIQNNVDDANRSVENIHKFVKIKLKDYKENNFNIIKEAIVVIQNLCELCNNFAKKHCVIIIKKLSEKMGDMKLKQNVVNLLMKFMEYHGPKYITNVLLKHMTQNVKSAPALKEFSNLMEKVVDDFGIAMLPVKELVDFGKFLASNANPQLRNSATALLCCIYKYIGPNIKKFLNDIKEATLKVIEAEFQKVTVVSVSENTNKIQLKGNAAQEAQAASGAPNLMDNLFPRVDISKKINSKLIKDLNEGKWQAKKEALEGLEKIFSDANMRILPNGLNELATCLKNKLDDGNKNMVRILVQFITKMIEALGSGCRNFTKALMHPIMKNLSDKMNLLREDVLKCLEKWSEMIGFESVLVYCNTYLLIENFELRTDLLKLILKNKSALSKFDTKELIPGVLSCLIDKTPSVRGLAEELAKEMLKIININNFYMSMNHYKPAIANTIRGIIEKYSSLICVEPVVNEDLNSHSNDVVMKNEFKQPAERAVSANPKVGKNDNHNTHKGNNKNIPKNRRDSSSSADNDSKGKNKKTGNANSNSNNAMPNIKPVSNGSQNGNTVPINNSNIPLKTQTPLLINANIKMNLKNKRMEAEKKLAFPNEFITQNFDSSLRDCMSQYINKSYVDNVYSNDVAKFNVVFALINSTMKSDPHLFFEVTDIWLKWILIRNLEMNNNLFFNNIVFDFLKNLFEFLKENECTLHQTENKIILEVLVSKLFTINVVAKGKAKQFFSDFCEKGVIKFDVILETLCDKFNSVFDISMKTELMELVNTLSTMCNFILEDKRTISILVAMYESICVSTKDEGMKKSMLELIRNVYMRNDDKQEMDEILSAQTRKEVSDIAQKKVVNVNNNHSENNPSQPEPSTIKFSRSPILPLQARRNNLLNNINNDQNSNVNSNNNPIPESESKDSMKIQLIDIIDQNKITKMLNMLYSSNFTEKINILLEFNDFFTNKYTECVVLLEKNIDQIIRSFSDLIKLIFTQTELNSDLIDMLKYLLTVFYKAALTKDVIENCDVETIYVTFHEVLKAILYEGLENVGQVDEGKKIIKSLNSLILKLMENFNPTLTFLALIKLIQNYRTDNSRICSLSIKCLLKISNILSSIISRLDIERILLGIYEFIADFEKANPELTPQSHNEEMCIKVLKTIIHEMIKITNDGIWNYYKSAIERNNLPDKFLRRWIQLILRSKNGLSIPSIAMSAQSNMSAANFSPMHSVKGSNSKFITSTVGGNNNFPLHNNLNPSAFTNPNFESEVKFYLNKLKNTKSAPENEKLMCEIIAILKRNKQSVDFLKDKMTEEEYSLASKIFNSVANSESSKQVGSLSVINSVSQNLTQTGNKNVSNFNVDKDKENQSTNMGNNPSGTGANNLNSSINSSNTSIPIKSLQEYRNRFYGISERNSDIKSSSVDIRFGTNNNVSVNGILTFLLIMLYFILAISFTH